MEDEDTFRLTGNYTDGVHSIVGRYTFRQFGQEYLRLMWAGEPYVVTDAEGDSRITATKLPSYQLTAIRASICVPILKQGRFVAAMAVHTLSPQVWDAEEVALVQRVASRCWESIERPRVTQELRESDHLFRALANSIANLAWMASWTESFVLRASRADDMVLSKLDSSKCVFHRSWGGAATFPSRSIGTGIGQPHVC